MLTLRFESDARSAGCDEPDITYVTEAPAYRSRSLKGGFDILIANENGVEIAHPVNGGVGGYDRCFVMNSHGKTVARYDASNIEAERPAGKTERPAA